MENPRCNINNIKLNIIYKSLVDKFAKDVQCLELKGLSVIADYFVICSGENQPQIKAIVDNVEENLKAAGITPLRIEGLSNGRWVLLDYDDIIIHIFDGETRAYYELEKLWLDAPRISLNGEKGLW
ncbi:MAG: ribosome silencing factor [Candidatus Magnetoovum sp. WYHC-5]|nr:ribosome silencing factor [Candidatus Magnetoovum sp. WYHC-5]